jgi:hypothetical protein
MQNKSQGQGEQKYSAPMNSESEQWSNLSHLIEENAEPKREKKRGQEERKQG